jgi:hypothetical protein
MCAMLNILLWYIACIAYFMRQEGDFHAEGRMCHVHCNRVYCMGMIRSSLMCIPSDPHTTHVRPNKLKVCAKLTQRFTRADSLALLLLGFEVLK